MIGEVGGLLGEYDWNRPIFIGLEGYEVTAEQWRQEREGKWPESFNGSADDPPERGKS